MITRSGKEYRISINTFSTTNQPFRQILLPEKINDDPKKKYPNNYINFDEASRQWRKNKISLGFGIFKYKT